MIFNLMASSAGTWILMIALVAVLVFFMIYNRKAQAKRQKETMDMLNAIKPGNKVKTIGGICGVVVEVCAEPGQFTYDASTEKAPVSPVEEKVEKAEEVKEEPVETTEEKTENE